MCFLQTATTVSMIASEAMKTTATLLSLAKVVAITTGLTACGARGKLAVDTPVLPYQPPDIGEITGIPEPDEADGDGSGTEPGK